MKQADCKGWIRRLPILMVLFSAAIRLDAENVPLDNAGVTVAVIDSGIDVMHEDLMSNILPISYDADSNSSPAKRYLPLNHGTYCAGILGAERNNDKGVAGVAPEVSILNISLDADDHTKPNFEQSAANAINWAWQNGADVLSCSWTCDESEIIVDAIDNALRYGRNYRGCVIVFSSGNRNVGYGLLDAGATLRNVLRKKF